MATEKPTSERHVQLAALVHSLERLVVILQADPDCRWVDHFQTALERSRARLERGCQQEELDALSTSVTSVYGEAGSFGDYAPAIYERVQGRWCIIEGMEDFNEVAREVYDCALALRVGED